MAEVLEHQRAGPDGGDGIGDLPAGNVGRGAVYRLEDRRRGALGVDVPRGGDADGAGRGRAEVREDVAEEVGGDNHVEALGVQHHLDGEAVDVILVCLYVTIALLDFGEAFIPVRHGDGDAV